ncbi:hypothetical protein AAG570_013516 [Ranatra chinensis]|uniref:Sodium channel protein Nach n=1 Tax=Ranatra chinensis TaxID=642074 RepID=A0ABD0Z0M9_9HEMI
MINMEYHATVFNPAYKNIAFHETLTEMGICHTYSGVVPNYITLKENPVTKNLIIPKCNYLNSLCYARIEDLPTIIKYYVHSPYEIPDSSDKYFVVMLNMEKDTAFRFQETVASPYLRRLQPKQRRCRFVDEPTFGPVYSYNLCRMQCRKKLAHQLCGCAPYFYMAEPSIPVCGVKGLKCLSEYSDYLIRLQKKDGNKVNCNCMFQCEATIYYIDRNTERRWTYPVPCNIRFRWAIEHYSKTRHKRDIIFGFEDLLVSLGGTAAFFLGCSVITFVEIAYFFTIRLCFYLIKN